MAIALPASAAEFRVAIGDWITKHLSELQLVGKDAAHMFVTLLIGMVLGAIIGAGLFWGGALRSGQPHIARITIEGLITGRQDTIDLLRRADNDAVCAFYEHLGYSDQNCRVLGRRLDG